VVPAGVAHCNQRQSSDLLIVGVTPRTDPIRICAGANRENMMRAKRAVEAVPLPAEDPIGGMDGALPRLWARSG
jgi:uncharacterized protein YjlB